MAQIVRWALCFKIILLLSAFLKNYNCDISQELIIEKDTNIDKYNLGKYIASIQLKKHERFFGWFHFCSGTIIGKRKILTAAHCLVTKFGVVPSEQIVAVVGLRNRFLRTNVTRVMEVARVHPHEQFVKSVNYNDIGFLILKEDIPFNDHLYIDMISFKRNTSLSQQMCTTFGWGQFYYGGPLSDELAFSNVIITKRKNCQTTYRTALHKNMLCGIKPSTVISNTCFGDSGGPLICNNVLVGIETWGSVCGFNGLHGVYTNVEAYREWIESGARRWVSWVSLNMLILIKILN